MRALTGILVVLCGVSACNTDPVWEPRQKVSGPTTSIDAPPGVDLPDIKIADTQEVDLVEPLLYHRAMYYRSIKALHQFYRDHGFHDKRAWAERELSDVERIKTFRYLLAAEIPERKLVPRESIAEADALLERGVALMDEGGHRTPVVYRENKMREAMACFRELIEKYPSSDKIDDAAFYCGEIHREYFKGEEQIAVRWYERAFEWNPQTPHPARFRAAVVYDRQLQNRDRALELYQQVIKDETADKSNVAYAVRRIQVLTEDAEVRKVSIPNTPATLATPTALEPAGDQDR